MSWNNNNTNPFPFPGGWDPSVFFNAGTGFGVDHTDQTHPWAQHAQGPFWQSFPFGHGFGGPRRGFGHGGRGGRGRRGGRPDHHHSPAGGPPARDAPPPNDPAADPETSVPEPDHPRGPPPPPHHGRHHHSPPPPPPGHGPGPHHRGPPPPYANHPLAQLINSVFPGAVPAADNAAADADNTPVDDPPFSPPLDLFSTPSAYTLHVALPGAKKQDIGIDWDADRSTLRIAGVLHRPADAHLLEALLPSHAERRVGFFERLVTLPPAGQEQQPRREHRVFVDAEAEDEKSDAEEGREEIDGAGITAKMEDGILVIVVPKVEKGWTEVRKVDIE